MKLNLRTLSSTMKLRGKTVLVRLDWNVPSTGEMEREASLKIERSIPFLRSLQKRGATVVILTHLGRPKGKDKRFSTKPLVKLLQRSYGLDVAFHPQSVGNKIELAELKESLASAKPGSLHLLENVRFIKGEEENAKALAMAYASLGDMFINDAFASCHRSHVSVSGLAKVLSSYAGPNLEAEVAALSRLLDKPKAPFIAIVGGLKLSTKLPVIEALCTACDKVLIGGAMATPFLKAKGLQVGRSVYEKDGVALAKKLLKRKEIVLPVDAAVTHDANKMSLRHISVTALSGKDMIVDLGPQTLKAWGAIIKSSKTILWNGPVGLSEHRATGFGSRFLARVIGVRAQGSAYGVAGGGDTLPVLQAAKAEHLFDFVSTGGGAMLEFIAKRGQLPGILALLR